MISYLIRRILYAIPILIGGNFITFALFFMVNSPDDMARMHLGLKHVTQMEIENWKDQHNFNQPLFYNSQGNIIQKFSHTLFFTESVKLFSFNFGRSDNGRDISHDITQRMWPSLALAITTLL